MRSLATFSNVIGAFCILAIALLIVLLIWGILPTNEHVGKLLLSLATIYISMLLIGGPERSRPR